MSWIKRNLYFLIGSVVALALMGMAGWYLYSRWELDNQAKERLNSGYAELTRLRQLKPSPSEDNLKEAQKQQEQLRELLSRARKHFEHIPSIPARGRADSQRFSAALLTTIAQLQRDAAQASVTLPPKYDFTFQAIKPRVTFAPESLPLLAAQLGKVKAICNVLFDAKVNALESLHRERVALEDDPQASPADYLEQKSVTNALAVLSPYEITFRCFSSDLAVVLDGFKHSPHGFIVRTLKVEPAPALVTGEPSSAAAADSAYRPEAVARRYGLDGAPAPVQPALPAAGMAPGTRSVSTRGGLPVIINEKLLKISLLLEVVELLPQETAKTPPPQAAATPPPATGQP